MKKIAIIPYLAAALLLVSCTGNQSSAEEESIVVEPSFKLADGGSISDESIEERSPAAYKQYFYYLKMENDQNGYTITIPKLTRNADGTYTSDGNLKSHLDGNLDITWTGSSGLVMELGNAASGSGAEACEGNMYISPVDTGIRMYSLQTNRGHILLVVGGNYACFLAMKEDGNVQNVYAYNVSERNVIGAVTNADGTSIQLVDDQFYFLQEGISANGVINGGTGSGGTWAQPPVRPVGFPIKNLPNDPAAKMKLKHVSGVKVNGELYYLLLYAGVDGELSGSSTEPPDDLYPNLPKLVLYRPGDTNFQMIPMTGINMLFHGHVSTVSVSDEGRIYMSGLSFPSTQKNSLELEGYMWNPYAGPFLEETPTNLHKISLYRVNGPTIPQMADLIQQLLAAPPGGLNVP